MQTLQDTAVHSTLCTGIHKNIHNIQNCNVLNTLNQKIGLKHYPQLQFWAFFGEWYAFHITEFKIIPATLLFYENSKLKGGEIFLWSDPIFPWWCANTLGWPLHKENNTLQCFTPSPSASPFHPNLKIINSTAKRNYSINLVTTIHNFHKK